MWRASHLTGDAVKKMEMANDIKYVFFQKKSLFCKDQGLLKARQGTTSSDSWLWV